LPGWAVLVAGCSPLVAAVQAFAALVYLGVYTPLKRRTSTNTWIGAIPGALPLLAGGVAAAGGVTQLSLLLFGLIFLWQLPHFFAIASIYRDQYRAGGLRMLSGDDPGDALLRWQLPVLVMSVVLLSVGPVLAGPAGGAYAICALLLGGALPVVGLALPAAARPRPRARRRAHLGGLPAARARGARRRRGLHRPRLGGGRVGRGERLG
jgi:protoheme IX farnesyltransferase